MKLERVDFSDPTVVTGYGGGGFRVGRTRYEGSILLQENVLYHWPVTAPEAVTLDSLAPLLDEGVPPELILFGTGSEMVRPPRAVVDAMANRQIAVEIMDTGAACRTYAVLLQEDRRVAAALIAV